MYCLSMYLTAYGLSVPLRSWFRTVLLSKTGRQITPSYENQSTYHSNRVGLPQPGSMSMFVPEGIPLGFTSAL